MHVNLSKLMIMPGGISSLEEEENDQLNQERRQLQDENWTHLEQLRSIDEREKVLEDLNHVRKTQETDILQHLTSNHVR